MPQRSETLKVTESGTVFNALAFGFGAQVLSCHLGSGSAHFSGFILTRPSLWAAAPPRPQRTIGMVQGCPLEGCTWPGRPLGVSGHLVWFGWSL